MRRIRPIKAKRALEELLMRRLFDEPACAGICAVIVKWRPRSDPDIPNWDATYSRHGELTPAAFWAAENIREALAVFDLEE
jgi:hypothetical protein